jgi:TonB family protein
MKPTAVFLALPLLFPVIGQGLDPRPSGRGQIPVCRGDDTDSPNCITPPRATYSPDSEYPDKERKAGHEGTVTLGFIVGTDGVAHDIRVSGPLSPDFDAAAVAAVKTWKFSPATKAGKPVPMEIAVQIKFHLPRPQSAN